MKDTTISLKLERSLKSKLHVVSKRENRTLSNFVEKLIKEAIAKYESKHGRIKTE
jgi:macrodomain Ter protein organizer (MatP/YcbG family)